MRAVEFHPKADQETIDAARRYENLATGLGRRFLLAIEQSIDYIRANPEASPKVGRRVRSNKLRRFPYSLLYEVHVNRVWIVALAHHKRRPFYWRTRL